MVVAVAVAVGFPGLVAIRDVARGLTNPAVLPVRVGYSLLWPTLGWCALIAALATTASLPAAWVMRRWRGAVPILVAPLLMPSYLAYAGWGMLRAPGTWLGNWLMRGPASAPAGSNWWPVAAGRVQAIAGLVLWAWPLAALVIGASLSRLDESVLEQLRVDGARRWKRGWTILAMTRAGVAAGAALVFLVMIGSAVPLHLAQVETYAIEVWRLLDELPSDQRWRVWVAAWPLVVLALIAGAALTRKIAEGDAAGEVAAWQQDRRLQAIGWPRDPARVHMSVIAAAAMWGLSVIGPLIVVLLNLHGTRQLLTFWKLSAGSISVSAQIAGMVAALALVLAGASWLGAETRARWLRLAAAVCLSTLLIAGLIPGILVGAATAQAWNRWEPLRWVADSPAIVVLGHLARFGFVAAIAGWLLARSEPAALRDLRRIDAGDSVRGWFQAAAQPRLAAMAGLAIASGVLSFHEIESAVMLQPPTSAGGGFAWRMLQALHYSREEDIVPGLATVLAVAISGSGLAAWLITRRR
jgi:hypothetical protein